jgi:hypothetical protein
MRQEQDYEVLNAALTFALSNLHTNVVCKVTAVDSKTISCKPVSNRVVQGVSIELPVFIEVPPIFMNGGSSYDAYPITIGDSCLLVVAERCFDAWYGGADFVSPVELRMHDYSDGFALVGIQPKASAITIPQVATMQGDRLAFGDLIRTGRETISGISESQTKVKAPILEGVLTGIDGSPPVIPQTFTSTELHADNGFSGTKVADGVSFVFVDGICIS